MDIYLLTSLHTLCHKLNSLFLHDVFAGDDFTVDMPTPLRVTFETVQTRIPIPFTLINDDIEEGYENFILELSYDEQDDDGTIRFVNTSTTISVKDDDGQ